MAQGSAEFRVRQLEKMSLFREFGHNILHELAHVAIRRRITKNKVLIYLGDVPSYIYCIIHGKVRLSTLLSDGREFIFSDLGPGDTFDLTSLFITPHSIMNAASVAESD